ncbi:hypothetical protein KGA66_20275 [Actinocrinis puniceicyclus]|uniref:Bacterial transcriptional activator domain-containing protein n=1 Tax=Actinocrinis puniceicyclus TaxID=977794 RepID=A0A8J7WSM9_9ACTN|nr:BTAD domain-containing putative transcriptional regulator [Actinocrinis puniceicyclus]MBS2965399.1 hypothetical protein [Actinocrinis puniceicyclus]
MLDADYRFLAAAATEGDCQDSSSDFGRRAEATDLEAEFAPPDPDLVAQTPESPDELARVLYGCVNYLAQAAEQISLVLDSVCASGGEAASDPPRRPPRPDRERARPAWPSRAMRPERAGRECARPGPGPGPEPGAADSSAPVVFRTLGTFCVEVDGHPVAASQWRSKKSRDLVKLLLARPGRPIPREEVMNVLWPGEPARELGSRLSVVLSTTRSVLAGGRRCTGPSPLGADRDVVTLDLGVAESDVVSFLEDADRALGSHRRGHSALDELAGAQLRYRGDFLECEPYADWAMPLREHARAQYINVLHALVRQAARARQPVLAIDYALRLLQCDAYDEQAHLWLFRLLRTCGRHGEARRAHANYLTRMREIGVEPAVAAS